MDHRGKTLSNLKAQLQRKQEKPPTRYSGGPDEEQPADWGGFTVGPEEAKLFEKARVNPVVASLHEAQEALHAERARRAVLDTALSELQEKRDEATERIIAEREGARIERDIARADALAAQEANEAILETLDERGEYISTLIQKVDGYETELRTTQDDCRRWAQEARTEMARGDGLRRDCAKLHELLDETTYEHNKLKVVFKWVCFSGGALIGFLAYHATHGGML